MLAIKRFFILLIFFTALVCGGSVSFAANGLFGSREVRYDSFDLFPKWSNVLTRHKKDLTLANLPCEAHLQTSCIFLEWHSFLNKLKNKPVTYQLDAVNRHMNKHQYITDLANWGVTDYWETPKEFFIKDGDCEDFAIAKFKSLLYLGFRNEDMRIVVLEDLNLKVAHAVLAVYVGNQAYILDNQAEQVIQDKKIKHYIPIYSINETNWWRHS